MGNLQKAYRPCCVVFGFSNLEQGLSGDRKTRYSRKPGHGRPGDGLAGMRDKWSKNRDRPGEIGTGGNPSLHNRRIEYAVFLFTDNSYC